MSDQFLSLAYSDINYKDIEKLKIIGKKVLKPSKGCFGTAVKIVSENSDFKQIASEIKEEISRNASVFSESVLSQSELIVRGVPSGLKAREMASHPVSENISGWPPAIWIRWDIYF